MNVIRFYQNYRILSVIRRNCEWCGKHATDDNFCSLLCKRSYDELMTKPFQAFYSYAQASRYSGKDVRTIRKYEGILFRIDKSIPSLHAKLQSCKVCGQLFKAHENRAGYCPTCSRAGAGRQAQANYIANRYQGEGNPNYVDGSARQNFRHHHKGKEWAKTVVKRDNSCRCCSRINALQAHHILPVALFPAYSLEVDNGITLCGHHHIELHRLKLDLLLLPMMYESLLAGKLLHNVLCFESTFLKLRLIPEKSFERLELLRVIPKNYHKEISLIHPEFAKNILEIL